MIVGYILIGLIVGFVGAVISLMADAALWQVFVAYSIAGMAGILAAAVYVLVRSKIRPAASCSAHTTDQTSDPDVACVTAPADDLAQNAEPVRRLQTR